MNLRLIDLEDLLQLTMGKSVIDTVDNVPVLALRNLINDNIEYRQQIDQLQKELDEAKSKRTTKRDPKKLAEYQARWKAKQKNRSLPDFVIEVPSNVAPS